LINSLLTKIVGTRNEREVKRMRPILERIASLEPGFRSLTDEQLRAKTAEFRQRLANGETLDDILPEAFAVTREGGRRVLGMRHFDVQLIGGMALHRGQISEMKTGEGKTLVATLAAYLNALPGKGVHVVTVNDYLAKRDSEWMGRLYKALGLTVGVIQHSMQDQERQEAYGADITYGTNNEYGFDYLRDNMKFDLASYVQRGHNFAIVDEVDSILIDEARTPLIISGPAEESTDKYYRINAIIPKLKPGARIVDEPGGDGDKKMAAREELEASGDYVVNEKAKTVTLTEQGMVHAEKLLGVSNLYDPSNMEFLHHVNQALRAHSLFKRDVDYLVENGQVIIIDEFTGRKMEGRRWSDGLHQAVEAKEKVKIERETQTFATITFQNYFRMYGKLGGMTGTAETEADEFDKIYKLEVLAIPTNRPLIRVENPDTVYRTEPEKYQAVVSEIKALNDIGRPVLVGTISIEKSEHLSALLKRAGIKHVVLNAKYHESEAEIVAQAGRFGAVTIATNMAGRGTDIILGGISDHRVRAAVHEMEKAAPQDERGAASPRRAEDAKRAEEMQAEAAAKVASDMANEFKKALVDRKIDAEARRELAKRYIGLLGAFSPDHPSIQAISGFADQVPGLGEYFEITRGFSRKEKEKIARSFYPQGEEPVDFLKVHPLKHALDLMAVNPAFEKIEAFLDQNERERVVALGGMHILATERHEARRIDNQLRGRAGRQGDPGSSRFYLSLQDDLMRIFGSDRISGLMLRLGMEEGVPIEHGMVTKSIERAQKQVEAQNFAMRKHLLEYDDVMNKQREAVYGMRRMILEGKDTRDHVLNLSQEVLDWYLDLYLDPKDDADEWDYDAAQLALKETYGVEVPIDALKAMGRDEVRATLGPRLKERYETKEREVGPELMQFHQRMIMLQIVDAQWKDHLYALDHLKEGIQLRSYGQRDPLVEYKKESFDMFQALRDRIDEEILRWVYQFQPVASPAPAPRPAPPEADDPLAAMSDVPAPRRAVPGAAARQPEMALAGAGRALPRNLTFNNPTETPSAFARSEPKEAQGGGDEVQTIKREGKKVGRNDPCPCGSGKKYKKCHGQS
jgi:preprotein translocase subunit SecA